MSYFKGQGSYAKFRISDERTISTLITEESILAISTEGNAYFGRIDSGVGEDVVLEETFKLQDYTEVEKEQL